MIIVFGATILNVPKCIQINGSVLRSERTRWPPVWSMLYYVNERTRWPPFSTFWSMLYYVNERTRWPPFWSMLYYVNAILMRV